MTDHLDSKNLVPFSKRHITKRHNGFQLPGVQKDRDEELLESIDPDLTAEDEGVIRRYLHYADTLLGEPEPGSLTLVQGGGPAKRLAANPGTHDPPEEDGSGDSTESTEDGSGDSTASADGQKGSREAA